MPSSPMRAEALRLRLEERRSLSEIQAALGVAMKAMATVAENYAAAWDRLLDAW